MGFRDQTWAIGHVFIPADVSLVLKIVFFISPTEVKADTTKYQF